MKVTIENVRRLGQVMLEIDEHVTLLAGNNQAGKTSTLLAIGAVLAEERCPITGKVAADAGYMTQRTPVWGKDANGNSVVLRYEGPKRSRVTIEGADWSKVGEWPVSGQSKITGTCPFRLSHMTAGLRRFSEMRAPERFAVLTELLRASPSLEEFREIVPELTKEQAKKIEPLVEAGMWDDAEQVATQQLDTARHDWRAVVGRVYTAKAAEEFCPEQMPEDRACWTRAHFDALVARSEELGAEIDKLSEPDTGQVQQWREAAKGLDGAKRALETCRTALEQADQLRQEARLALARTPTPGDPAVTAKCPCCDAVLVLTGSDPALRPAGDEPDAEELARMKLAREAAEDAARQASRQWTQASNNLHMAQQALDRMEDAQAQLEKLGDVPVKSRRAELQAELSRVMAEGEALKTWLKAAACHARVQTWEQVRGACQPDGLRAKALAVKLIEFNDLLARTAKPLKTFQVVVTPDMDVLVNGDAIVSRCGAERYLADALISLAVAELEQAPIVLIDAADALEEQNRGVMLARVLGRTKRRVVVAAAMGFRDDCPDMVEFGLGRTYWVEQGRIEPLGAVSDTGKAAA